MGCVHPALESLDHRPWPLPSAPWSMTQTWHDLLFAHWAVAPALVRALVPATLPLDLFAGQAWIGVVPFWMSAIRRRGWPAIPGLSRFPELNVRTYVTLDDKPGVYFFSLDAGNRAAVWAARRFYHLPYFKAQMSARSVSGAIAYHSRRNRGDAEFRASYRPTGAVEPRPRGSLAHWLTERYCLYTVHDGRVFRGDIHHQPWPLQDAEAAIETNTVASAAGIALPPAASQVHFARRISVLIWPLRAVR